MLAWLFLIAALGSAEAATASVPPSSVDSRPVHFDTAGRHSSKPIFFSDDDDDDGDDDDDARIELRQNVDPPPPRNALSIPAAALGRCLQPLARHLLPSLLDLLSHRRN